MWRWRTAWKQRSRASRSSGWTTRDAAGVAKRALVVARGEPGGLAFSGHMDTVPDTGWREDPWSARVEGDVLRGLGSTDMKGPVAALIVAARELSSVTLLITTDEETTKQGARAVVERSALARRMRPRGIIVAEPTRMAPVRGHRAQIGFTCEARGVQAHSSTGRGENANWRLLPFLVEMRGVRERLREDGAWQDAAYDPPFSDFNLVIDNHGAANNVTVPLATARIKFRYSAGIDPAPIAAAVRGRGGAAWRGRGGGARGHPTRARGGSPAGSAVRGRNRPRRRDRTLRHGRFRVAGAGAVRRARPG